LALRADARRPEEWTGMSKTPICVLEPSHAGIDAIKPNNRKRPALKGQPVERHDLSCLKRVEHSIVSQMVDSHLGHTDRRNCVYCYGSASTRC
jgi:hypothetical protein